MKANRKYRSRLSLGCRCPTRRELSWWVSGDGRRCVGSSVAPTTYSPFRRLRRCWVCGVSVLITRLLSSPHPHMSQRPGSNMGRRHVDNKLMRHVPVPVPSQLHLRLEYRALVTRVPSLAHLGHAHHHHRRILAAFGARVHRGRDVRDLAHRHGAGGDVVCRGAVGPAAPALAPVVEQRIA